MDLCAKAAFGFVIAGAFDFAEAAAGDGVVVFGFALEMPGEGVAVEELFDAELAAAVAAGDA